MNGADFAFHIVNAPAVSARPGSVDELAALGLDRHLRLAESIKYQGEAGFCELEKPTKCLTDGASSWKSILQLLTPAEFNGLQELVTIPRTKYFQACRALMYVFFLLGAKACGHSRQVRLARAANRRGLQRDY